MLQMWMMSALVCLARFTRRRGLMNWAARKRERRTTGTRWLMPNSPGQVR